MCRWCWMWRLCSSECGGAYEVNDGGSVADEGGSFIEAYVPNTTPEQRRDPWISPFFADLTKMKLPPALFTCGTLDCLMDDSVFMSAKWAMSGAESILKIYPGRLGVTLIVVLDTDRYQEHRTGSSSSQSDKSRPRKTAWTT